MTSEPNESAVAITPIPVTMESIDDRGNSALPPLAARRRRNLRFWGRGTQLLPAWLVPFLSLIVVTTFFAVTAGSRFLSVGNFSFLLQQSAIVAIPAFGVTLIIIAGSIDLSVGSLVGLTGMVGALVGGAHGLVAGLAAALATGVLAGLCNGFTFAVLKIPSFIVTLGMLSVARGVTVKVSGSQPANVPDSWLWFGQMPGILILFAACFVGTAVLLHLTSFGRRAVALGGQERVARLSGIKVTQVKILLFCFGGLMAALGGIALSARVGAATPDAASGFELTAIAAVVLGGTPLTGGIGNVVNTVIGALVLSILLNGMVILGVSGEVQLITQGIVLCGAVLLSLDRSKIGIIK
jgi:ribose/xylose/arabinose/galactoside ABC-type transport system permease subunit